MSCLNCQQTEKILDLDTVMYNSFGGYTLELNGKYYLSVGSNVPYEKCPTARDFDNLIGDKKGKWTIVMDLPLRGAKYRRGKKGEWLLIEKNKGFA